ncbi:MAG: hypothetical protein EOO55_02880 [Hymenobacter sp.]|nr:MAG: hypothetical protein EOO55_02880 [Hymenobacter sp.]
MEGKQTSCPGHIEVAIDKFHTLNDDLPGTQEVVRRVFFKFLRGKPTLTSDEVEKLHIVADLLAAVCQKC